MDTIAAIATPFGHGGIGIVRISGPEAIPIARRLFCKLPTVNPDKSADNDFSKFVSHRAQHGFILDPCSGLPIDEVLLIPMIAPYSYTREDVIEIQSHSGLLLLQKLLALVIDNGARTAEPGEFTKRAFLNGRLDLSQAEGVIDLINASSEKGMVMAAAHLAGAMRDQINQLIENLTELCAHLQAAIEFPEDCEPYNTFVNQQSLYVQLIQPIKKLLENYQGSHFYRDGLRLSIVGRPNVGKSSILNRLLDCPKAIVTPYPGTTRDPVEGVAQINGIPIYLTDTAGLHASQDPIEQIGMQKTKDSIAAADMVLFVLAANQPFSLDDESIYREIGAKETLVVINKIDLVRSVTAQLPTKFCDISMVPVSALNGTGFNDLKKRLLECCGHATSSTSQDSCVGAVPTIRQKNSLDLALKHLLDAERALDLEMPQDMVLIDLEIANCELKTIVGQTASIDLLDEIFSRFCIGK